MTLALASDLAVTDHHDGSVWLIANAINFDGTDARVDEAHADAVARLDAMQAALAAPVVSDVAVLGDVEVPELEFRSTREE
jgi:anthranilate synthase component 1